MDSATIRETETFERELLERRDGLEAMIKQLEPMMFAVQGVPRSGSVAICPRYRPRGNARPRKTQKLNPQGS